MVEGGAAAANWDFARFHLADNPCIRRPGINPIYQRCVQCGLNTHPKAWDALVANPGQINRHPWFCFECTAVWHQLPDRPACAAYALRIHDGGPGIDSLVAKCDSRERALLESVRAEWYKTHRENGQLIKDLADLQRDYGRVVKDLAGLHQEKEWLAARQLAGDAELKELRAALIDERGRHAKTVEVLRVANELRIKAEEFVTPAAVLNAIRDRAGDIKVAGLSDEELLSYAKLVPDVVGALAHLQHTVTLELARREKRCIVCTEQPPSVILLPCAHYQMCDGCAPKVDKCPTCRAAIVERKKVYQ